MCKIRPFLISIQIALLAASVAGCGTANPPRNLYLTDDGDLTLHRNASKKRVIRQEKIEEARLLPECQAAQVDTSGHWGSPTDGFRISLRFPTNTFRSGEPVIGVMYVRNVSRKDLLYGQLILDV